MAHQIYHTAGFVVRGATSGESNKLFHIITPDLGLVLAHAQAVRELKSKLRYHLQEATWLTLSLVRGKELWRVVHAERPVNFLALEASPAKRKICVRIAHLIYRVVHGESGCRELCGELETALANLATANLGPAELRSLEYLLVLKILYRLGYFGDDDQTLATLVLSPWSNDVITQMSSLHDQALKTINHSLAHSQL